MIGYIYKITSPSGKSYIGQTTMEPKRRWGGGYNYSRAGLIGKAIDKYGWQNMSKEIVESVEVSDEKLLVNKLNQREIYWGNYFNTLCPNGYNFSFGGNKIMSESTKNKLRKKTKQYFSNPENRTNLSNAIKNRYSRNPEKYSEISKANAANMHTKEARKKAVQAIKKFNKDNPEKIIQRNQKIGQANKGKSNGMYGKTPANKGGIGFKHTQDSIEKMRQFQKKNANSERGILARKLGAHNRWHREKKNPSCIYCG